MKAKKKDVLVQSSKQKLLNKILDRAREKCKTENEQRQLEKEQKEQKILNEKENQDKIDKFLKQGKYAKKKTKEEVQGIFNKLFDRSKAKKEKEAEKKEEQKKEIEEMRRAKPTKYAEAFMKLKPKPQGEKFRKIVALAITQHKNIGMTKMGKPISTESKEKSDKLPSISLDTLRGRPKTEQGTRPPTEQSKTQNKGKENLDFLNLLTSTNNKATENTNTAPNKILFGLKTKDPSQKTKGANSLAELVQALKKTGGNEKKVKELSKANPGVDMAGLLHKSKIQSIKDTSKNNQDILQNREEMKAEREIEKSAQYLKSLQLQENPPSSAFSMLIAATENKLRVVKGHLAITKTEAGQKEKTNKKDGFGRTSIFYAAFNGNEEMCDLLLACGADLTLSDIHKRNILHYAAMKDNSRLIEILARDIRKQLAQKNLENKQNNVKTEKPEEKPEVIPFEANAQNREKVAGILAEMDEIDKSWHNIKKRHFEEILNPATQKLNNISLGKIKFIDKGDKMKRTPLHIAAFYDYKEVVQILLNLGANSEIEDCIGFRPIDLTEDECVKKLLLANSKKGSKKGMVDTLIASGFMQLLAKKTGDKSQKATTLTAKGKKAEKKKEYSLDIRDLKLMDTDKIKKGCVGSDHETYLMLAAKERNLEAFTYILSLGPDLIIKNNSGQCITHVLCIQNQEKYLRSIFETTITEETITKTTTKNLNYLGVLETLDIKSNQGKTPLQLTIENKNLKMFHFILNKLEERERIGINSRKYYKLKDNLEFTDKKGDNCLVKAGRANELEMAKYIINMGVNLYSTNTEKKNILHYAIINNNREMIEYLVTYDGDKNTLKTSKDCKGKIPANYDPTKKYKNSLTTIWDLCKNSNNLPELVEILNEGRINPNLQTRIGKETPLHLALFAECNQVVQILLSFGADPDITNKKGVTGREIIMDIKGPGGKQLRKMLDGEPVDLGEKEEIGVGKKTKKEKEKEAEAKGICEEIKLQVEARGINLESLFKRLDLNGDGVLSQIEFEGIFIILDMGISSQQVRTLISYSDTNQDGKIQYNEFLNAIYPPPPQEEEEEEAAVEEYATGDDEKDENANDSDDFEDL